MSSSRQRPVHLLVLIVNILVVKSEVQVQLYTKALEGAVLSDTYILDMKCSGTSACSLVKCGVLCASNVACKSLGFQSSKKTCVHYSVQASDPAAQSSSVQQAGWLTFEKDSNTSPANPRDCSDIGANDGSAPSGVYTIYPSSSSSLQVYCLRTHGHLWTVIDKRVDDTMSFQKPLAEFVTGFGSASGNYWIGFNAIRELTSSSKYELLAIITATYQGLVDARYSVFSVGAAPDYSLRYDEFVNGTAGDALFNFKDQHFEGRATCTGCVGWWVETYGCCGDTPHVPMNGEAVWASDDDYYFTQFRMMIRRME
ncbi:fibrinogen-like protein A [Littorina saxatilis]|uniref:fibrinogen-like protein A n=1 Tax=Littorina saxatilis TaxID=31220 RepID=UPI0038B465D2